MSKDIVAARISHVTEAVYVSDLMVYKRNSFSSLLELFSQQLSFERGANTSDGIHPNDAGFGAHRQQWAAAMLATIYAHQ